MICNQTDILKPIIIHNHICQRFIKIFHYLNLIIFRVEIYQYWIIVDYVSRESREIEF